ncbi:MAG: M48 family metalloprotease [Pseudomonadota bacterium]
MPSIPRLLSSLLISALLATGCAPVPGGGGGGSGSGVSNPGDRSVRRADAQRIGAETHQQLLAAYGGAYRDPQLQRYVESVGRRITAVTEQPNESWTFTILDTPEVNAFATPGGYIYVTRGLLALANNEAELAGVLGHEIGHVTADHSFARRRRQGRANLGAIGAAVLGAAVGGDAGVMIQRAGVLGAQANVAAFSRENEFEADMLGVEYIARAGYDPFAQAELLSSLGAQSALNSRLQGREYNPNQVSFLATHPANADRVREAIAAARRAGMTIDENAPTREAEYMAAIDGMTYGDSAEQGFVRGRRFSHPVLRFTYQVPERFTIINSAAQVTAIGPNNAGMILDGLRDEGQPLDAYIARAWAPAIAEETRTSELRNLRRLRINGLDAAQGEMIVELRAGVFNARLTAIRHGGQIYRLTALSPRGNGGLNAALADATRSFRALSAAEAGRLRPYRIRTYRARGGDTVQSLARRLPAQQLREQRFRVLNDIEGPLVAGDLVKLVE